MNDYVTKPVSPQVLADALDRWLPRDGLGLPPTEPILAGPLPIIPASSSTIPAALSQTIAAAVVNLPAIPVAVSGVGTDALEPVVFDRVGLMARVMEDPELASAVVGTFLAEAPALIGSLKGCVAASETETATRQAHSIKGAAANVGGEALRGEAQVIEQLLRAGELEAAGRRLPDLEAAFHRLREALESEDVDRASHL